MTDREKILFIEALVWKKAYSDCEPEVGWGPSMKMLAEDISKLTGVVPNDDELSFIIVTAEMRG